MDPRLKRTQLFQFLQNEVCSHNRCAPDDPRYLSPNTAIFLKLLNTLHFKNYLDTFFEWLPQQIFFFCTFGYMCMLIVAKWAVPWGEERPIGDAPSIIAQMIALPLKLGSTEDKPMWGPEYQ
jgi:hypothetical protein